MKKPRLYDSYNAGYAQELYEAYLRDPQAVDGGWHQRFDGDVAEEGLIPVSTGAEPFSEGRLRAVMAAVELVDAYRLQGHTAARLDPLGSEPSGHPLLNPEYHGITPHDLDAVPLSVLGLGDAREASGHVLAWLKAIYSDTVGYEYEHLSDPNRREWLRTRIESGWHRQPLDAEEKRELLRRLSEVEGFEQFLHRAYLGQKRFSIEGNDMLVPMLDLAIEQAAAEGAREVVLGMAHRGRLNVLVHVLGRPYASLIAEFEGLPHGSGTGDVKYHLGADGTYATRSGEPLTVTMAPNPSHLEYVNPVVEGMTRAKQTNRSGPRITQNDDAVLPVLIHGDAAFTGQGIVAETLNLSALPGYRTGGTLHVIVNNQIGFTTTPAEDRSTRYASDLARGYDVPIFHVNADDPEACLAVVRLALAFRHEFHDDVLIDMVGYRRYGHNEGDEPAYTQPLMYQAVADHPTVRKLWADRLVEQGVVDEAFAESLSEAVHQRLVEAQEKVKEGEANRNGSETPPVEPAVIEAPVQTAVPEDRLHSYHRQLHTWPDGLHVNPKLERQLERRAGTFDEGGPIDWAHAEALAFASLLADGTPIRLTGQDSERGTFSQRHLALHDVQNGDKWIVLAHIEEAQAPFEVYNSPLSEVGVLGFEYGYSTATPRSLALWEAQFGDFVNGAEVVLDQFVVSGRAKWGQQSRLVLLLPHGYEGQGPEHSSARLERFLQLAAEDNIRVANVSTPAQYFHLLRRQALLSELRPLVLFTPKSLLRHPRAVSTVADLSGGTFHMVLDDDDAREHAGDVRRIVLCSGKVYYDLTGSDLRKESETTAVLRLEQLYPLPEEDLKAVLQGYPAATELVWAQEEPANMGAWTYLLPHLRRLAAERFDLGYAGRPDRASPAEGYARAHREQQEAIVQDAFTASPSIDLAPRQVK
ncbi:MAG: 2-oxoglutarate dehydrogenase E1 component [Gemmatimonadota bacterium]